MAAKVADAPDRERGINTCATKPVRRMMPIIPHPSQAPILAPSNSNRLRRATALKRMTDVKNLEEIFQAKVDAEQKIEPKDWMPEKYRKTLVRQISQHA